MVCRSRRPPPARTPAAIRERALGPESRTRSRRCRPLPSDLRASNPDRKALPRTAPRLPRPGARSTGRVRSRRRALRRVRTSARTTRATTARTPAAPRPCAAPTRARSCRGSRGTSRPPRRGPQRAVRPARGRRRWHRRPGRRLSPPNRSRHRASKLPSGDVRPRSRIPRFRRTAEFRCTRVSTYRNACDRRSRRNSASAVQYSDSVRSHQATSREDAVRNLVFSTPAGRIAMISAQADCGGEKR